MIETELYEQYTHVHFCTFFQWLIVSSSRHLLHQIDDSVRLSQFVYKTHTQVIVLLLMPLHTITHTCVCVAGFLRHQVRLIDWAKVSRRALPACVITFSKLSVYLCKLSVSSLLVNYSHRAAYQNIRYDRFSELSGNTRMVDFQINISKTIFMVISINSLTKKCTRKVKFWYKIGCFKISVSSLITFW